MVWALTVGVVLGAQVVLWRLLTRDDGQFWPYTLATAVQLVLSAVCARWLARRLHRDERPRWRLTPREALPLLPCTLAAFLLVVGFAGSTYWPDWLGAGVGALALGYLCSYALQRLDQRVPDGSVS